MPVRVDPKSVKYSSQRERVELVLSHLDQLPTLPSVVTRLLSVTSSDESTVADVVRLIESDAAITAAVLRLVRRADLGVRGDAMTVARAVSLMGFNAVRNAVLSVQLHGSFAGDEDEPRLATMRRELWRHNLAVACAAEMIAERVEVGTGGEAFVCGLLHDIGKIALDSSLPKSYARVVKQVESDFACICDAEREVFGLDHNVAGKHLALRWGFPRAIVDCVWLHHQSPDSLPSSVASRRLVEVTHVADCLVRREGIGFTGYHDTGDMEEVALSLGLTSSIVEEIASLIDERMAPLCEVIGLEEATDPNARNVSLATANRQLGRLNEKLAMENRRLEVRSACLTAIERFSKRLGDSDRVMDVCEAAAESARALFSAKQAMTFYREPESPCFFVASPGTSTRAHPVSCLDPDEPIANFRWEANLPNKLAPGLLPAPVEFESLWQRCLSEPPRSTLWMLPLTASDRVVGAVLLSAPEESVYRFRASPEECDVLSTTIGLALTSAKNCTDAERTSEELADLNRRLRSAQKELVRTRSISMIAAMAAGAAHELNNPLSVISGRAQMMLAACEDEGMRRALQIVVDQAQRATGIVTELMQFAKPTVPEPTTQKLAEVLDRACQHWHGCFVQEGGVIDSKMSDPEATIHADPKQLNEILDALLANALEARGSESLHVQINSPSGASDETVRIVVADNGVGMTRDVQEHAFDPFFSSRSAGRGRGLGLSRAYRLAEINGGRLWLESKPQAGTTVTIELPARASASKT